MARLQDIIQLGLRAAQPLATNVSQGTLYHVTDELVTERSNGTIWESYGGGVGTVGINGTNGINGTVGIDGRDGSDGLDGLNGRAVQIFEQADEPLNAQPGDFWITPA